MTDLSLPFTPRLPPLPHQASFLRDHGHDEAHGLLWAAGVGKSKATIDNAALLLCAGKIDALFVVAPNGVHRVWAQDELPKHWPHDAPKPYAAFEWISAKTGNKGYQKAWAEFLARTAPPNNAVFGVLCMSYDSLMTDAGKQASWDFIRKRKALLIADESQKFKTPSSKRNIRAYAVSQYAPYRRIASATPMDSPFDIYSQMKWLEPTFWQRTLGIGSFAAFKAHFGNWRKMTLNTGASFEVLNEKAPYKNLDQLQAALATLTTRLTEEQADLGLPSATYRRIVHTLTEEQARAYEQLKEECLTQLDSGEVVTAEHVLTLRLRLMQIGCGFITPTAGAEPVPFARNPRQEDVAALLHRLGPDEPTLCWGMFKQDAVALVAASRSAGRQPVVYDPARPEETLEAWKAGKAHDLIGNLGSGLVEGHTLVRAAHCLFYSNTPSAIKRYQAERRILRIGQTRPVTYYDFLATGTTDAANLEAVRRKAQFTGEALGDDPARAAAWLRATLLGEARPTQQDAQAALFDDLTAAQAYEAAFS